MPSRSHIPENGEWNEASFGGSRMWFAVSADAPVALESSLSMQFSQVSRLDGRSGFVSDGTDTLAMRLERKLALSSI
jgi:hypothetical protein